MFRAPGKLNLTFIVRSNNFHLGYKKQVHTSQFSILAGAGKSNYTTFSDTLTGVLTPFFRFISREQSNLTQPFIDCNCGNNPKYRKPAGKVRGSVEIKNSNCLMDST